MKKLLTTVLTFSASTMPSFAGDLIQPKAGMWEQTTSVSPDGKSWHPGVKNKGCLSEAQASEWESQVRQQIAAARCTANTLSVVDGKINGLISCNSINQPVVTISGEYTSSAYSVDLASSGVVDLSPVGGSANAPLKAFAKWEGRHLGPCSKLKF